MSVNQLASHAVAELQSAVQRYFDLMYDCDVSRFDQVFHPTAQLHGVDEATLTVWPAQTYRDILAKRVPPAEMKAPRHEEVLLLDPVGDRQALVKVRVRIHDKVFVDHLCFLKIDGAWRITSKTFHHERRPV